MSSTASSSRSAWQRIWDHAQPTLEDIRHNFASDSSPTSRITRVGKLDAELLDQELVQVLQEPLMKALNLIDSTLKARFEPELALLIQLTLYKFSVWDTGASYGAKLQGLKYAAPAWCENRIAASSLPRRVLLIHGTLTLIMPYIHNKIRAHALSRSWPDAPSSDRRRKAWDLLTRLESSHSLLALLNFVGFLWDGRYRTVCDRLLSMRLISSQRLTQRDVSYEFMNRQMVWHAFTEFLLFLLPLINARALSKRISRLWSGVTLSSLLPGSVRSLAGMEPEMHQHHKTRRGKYWTLSLDQCAICYEDASTNPNPDDPLNTFTSLTGYPTHTSAAAAPIETTADGDEPPPHPVYTPYITDCGHTYCYVCITGRMMRTAEDASGVGPGGTRWECLRCGEAVTYVERVEMDAEDTDTGGYLSGDDMTFNGSDIDFTDMSGSTGDVDSESYTSE